MGAKKMLKFIARHPRIAGRPDKYNNHVRFAFTQEGDGVSRSAQFADISESGMRLISRLPLNPAVDEKLDLEFTLHGSDHPIKTRAQVVRVSSDYVFAVRFLGQPSMLAKAIAQYARYARSGAIIEMARSLKGWVAKHRKGLVIAIVGSVLLGSLGFLTYVNSDQGQHRPIRAWAAPAPPQEPRF